MSDKNLRNKLIRLAHAKPELRKDLLPLLNNKTSAIVPKYSIDWTIETHDGGMIDDGEMVFVSYDSLPYMWRLVGKKAHKEKILSKNIGKNMVTLTTDTYIIHLTWYKTLDPKAEGWMNEWVASLKTL